MSRVGLAGAVILIGSWFPATGAAGTALAGSDEPPPPVVTVNDFLPENRDLGDCISSLPRPDCGSDARGGWHQGLVFGAVLAGLALIAWRIIASSRRARATASSTDGAATDAAPISSGGDEPADRRRTPRSR